MRVDRRRPSKFPLWAPFVLILGIAIGFSLNLETARLMFGRPVESRLAGLPSYLIEPPDVLLVQAEAPGVSRAVLGEHLVGPDGCVHLGSHGRVYVTGMTVEEAGAAIAKATQSDADAGLWIEVMSYNSKACYVINRAPTGDSVTRLPITGGETVMDALAAVQTEVGASGQSLSVHRPSTDGVGREEILPVRWDASTGGVAPNKNYQLFPGDRVIVETLAGS